MLLSKLVYLSIKNITYYDDSDFTENAFLNGTYNGDPNYASNINNIFTPINEAIARLSDLERIPYKVAAVFPTNYQIQMTSFGRVKEVISLAQIKDNGYRTLSFKVLGNTSILITDEINSSLPVLVEFKEDIPQFDSSDVNYSLTTPKDVDLSNYGIKDSMANYIMEYAMGKLSEQIAPELANLHITRAEQYFANINAVKSAFPQQNVEVKFGI